MASISAKAAIARGQLLVNGPVMLLLVGPGTAALLLGGRTAGAPLVGFAFVGGFVLAWLWWSLAVPRWRVWAYERVEDVAELKRQAVVGGLLWPDGSFFERTEIRTSAQKRRIAELEARAGRC